MLGPSKEIFDPHFFSSFEPAWATDQWVKIVSILVKISQSYSNFSVYHTAQSQSPRSIILRRVNLPTVSYCAESCDFSVSYLKGQSNNIFDLFFLNSSLPGPLSNGL